MPAAIDPHAAGSTRHSQWWVVNNITRPGGPRGPQQTNYAVVMATSRPVNTVAGPFSSQSAAQNWVNNANQAGNAPTVNLNPFGWLSSLGGMIGSGIESGFVQFFTDLWKVIVGPLEILLGILIGMWVLVIYFRHDIAALVGAAGGLRMAM